MHEIMIFEGHEVEVFELNGAVLFNPYHVGECLDMAPGTVKDHMSKMNKKQVVKVKNSACISWFLKAANQMQKPLPIG